MARDFLVFLALLLVALVAWSASMWWQISVLGRPRALANGFRCRGGAEVDGYPMTWPLAELTATASTIGFRFVGRARIAPMIFDRAEVVRFAVVRRAGNRRLVVHVLANGSLVFIPANWRTVVAALGDLGWEVPDG